MSTLACAKCENKKDTNELLKQYFSMRCKLKIIEKKKKVSKFKAEASNATNLDTVIEEYINLPFINENMVHYKQNQRKQSLALNSNPIFSLTSNYL